MSIVLEAFPKVSRDLLVMTGYISTKYEFSFRYRGETHLLNAVNTDSSTSKSAVVQMEDPGGEWHPEKHELSVKCKCIINNPLFLFGENGLAPSLNSEIGVGIMWLAPDSSIRGIQPVGIIRSDSTEACVIDSNIHFDSKTLRGNLFLQTVLYLKKRGTPSEKEKHLARYSGTILGVLDETRVIIDGNGSMFPIHMVANPTEPLWWVHCRWEDPTQDSFTDDNFCIYLNTAHKDYGYLNANEGIKNSPLLMEILCSSIQMLVMKVLNDSVYRDDTIHGVDLKQGSVSSVVNYFIHVYSWSYDKDNPEALAASIRKSLMQKL